MIAADDLVRLALAKLELGERDAAKLATRLGLTSYSSPQRVRRWLSGENEPDYELTMKLLELVGGINREALRLAGPEAEADLVRKAKRSAMAGKDLMNDQAASAQRRPRRGAA